MLDYDGPPSNCSKETTEDDAVSVTLATLDHGSPGLQVSPSLFQGAAESLTVISGT